MGLIIALLILGAFFLVAELVFLPGVTLGAILSLVGFGAAVYFGFVRFGFVGGVITLVVAIALALLVTVLSLRAKTWQRLALKDKVNGKSTERPETTLSVGARGVAVSRLSPMGKVEIDGKVYEAKSTDVYIDQRSAVEVVGFENFTAIVRRAE
jgi:membrane-bound ClpP family serine protease